MNDVLRIACLKIALQRAFLGRAILIFTAVGSVALFVFCKRRKARKLAENTEDVDMNPVYGEYAEVYVETEVEDTNDYYASSY